MALLPQRARTVSIMSICFVASLGPPWRRCTAALSVVGVSKTSNSWRDCCSAKVVSCGGVEDGRGSLGPLRSTLRFPSHRITGGGRPPPKNLNRIASDRQLVCVLKGTRPQPDPPYGLL